MINSKQSTYFTLNKHLKSFINSFAVSSTYRIICIYYLYLLFFIEYIRILLRNTIANMFKYL